MRIWYDSAALFLDLVSPRTHAKRAAKGWPPGEATPVNSADVEENTSGPAGSPSEEVKLHINESLRNYEEALAILRTGTRTDVNKLKYDAVVELCTRELGFTDKQLTNVKKADILRHLHDYVSY